MKLIRRERLHAGAKYNYVADTLANADGREVRHEFVEHPGAAVILIGLWHWEWQRRGAARQPARVE